MRLLGPGCPPGLSYSGFWRKEGFVIKTCTGVLFITEKTGNNPIAPARDWSGRYTEEGTEMPACDAGNVTGGRAAWRQEPRVWGAKYNAVCAQRVITGHSSLRWPSAQGTASLHALQRGTLGSMGGASPVPGPPTPDRPASGLCRTPAQGSTRGKQNIKVMSLCPDSPAGCL